MIWLLLAVACAPTHSRPTTPMASPVAAQDIVIEPSAPMVMDIQEIGPPAIRNHSPSASAPILREKAVVPCPDVDPLCAQVRCTVANQMVGTFPSRWTFSLVANDQVIRENVRWIVRVQNEETRDIAMSLATLVDVQCSATAGVQVAGRAIACEDGPFCAAIVCSVWTNGASTSTYVDAHIEVPAGGAYDHDAVRIDVPANGEVVQQVFEYRSEAPGWAPARARNEPTEVAFTPSCQYWQDGEAMEPMP